MSTVLSLSTDRSEYCKYEPGLSTINVRGTCDAVGASVTITLNRLDVYGQLASTTATVQSNNQFAASFDLNGPAMVDGDGINRAIQGDYAVTATSGTNTMTAPLAVSIVSVAEMHQRWLYGATLYASEIVAPKFQPQVLPASFVEVNPFFLKGPYPLVYDPAAGWSFAGGPSMPTPANSGFVQIILLDARQADWVRISVDTTALPTTKTSETIILDQAQISDYDVMMFVRQAADWVENKLGFALEPHTYTSRRLVSKYPKTERIADGAGFYGTFNASVLFPNIELPLQHLLAVADLEGWYNQAAVIKVPAVWIQANEQEGNIELVPTSGQASAIVWLGVPVGFFSTNYNAIPEFWQYSVTAGLRDLRGPSNMIREAIAKKGAIETLLVAGAAYRAGISSRSTSRDNVSFSESYTSSAMYGIYAHLTIPYQDWLNENLPTLRRRIGGIVMTTLM